MTSAEDSSPNLTLKADRTNVTILRQDVYGKIERVREARCNVVSEYLVR